MVGTTFGFSKPPDRVTCFGALGFEKQELTASIIAKGPVTKINF
jgi:hypothetical protein